MERASIAARRQQELLLFKYLNRYFMLPLLRHGYGRWIASPFMGYFMLLHTKGHKSGLPRHTPLNYAIDNGCIICLAGFGEKAHWLANIRHDQHVEVQLPGRMLRGSAEIIEDTVELRRLAVMVARNAGFALIFEHPRCLLMTDAQLADQFAHRPVVRIQPEGGPVVAGAYDPGGKGWVLPTLIQGLIILSLMSRVFRPGSKREHL